MVHRIGTTLCEALFASDLQPSGHPGAEAVNAALMHTILARGPQGCIARMAQEFGDHPDVVATRMRWAKSTPLIGCSGAGHVRPAGRDPHADLIRAPPQLYPNGHGADCGSAPLPAPSRHRVPRLRPRKRRTKAHAAGQR